jgi:Ni/Co efflux regulator RcnB
MKKFLYLAPLAILALPMAAPSASAETVVIKENRHDDNGLHRGWRNGHGHGVRKVVVRHEVGRHGPARVTKTVTRTNASGDRVTKKVTREVN